jgi:hypothetical protein
VGKKKPCKPKPKEPILTPLGIRALWLRCPLDVLPNPAQVLTSVIIK